MDVQAIQAGLATAAATITGLASAPTVPDSLNSLPIFAPAELEMNYDKAFGGALTEAVFTCALFTSRGDAESGRVALAGLMAPAGAGSIKAAIESDRTLGGAAKTLRVESVRGAYRLYTVAGVDYLGAMFQVRVWG
jgi:hypothetical protein